MRRRATGYFRSIGYAYVVVDLRGFHLGRLSETLRVKDRERTGRDYEA